ncbi:hypothetical protein HELRODRAFT_84435 [Helobdella robusta]|uniref:SH2 domain-containing protein n=1 Tax=Helobdella robusta TaxID=6412 RepID=T1G5I6_HELRO|nr:hypothetical protein HELRODRAFT_84435 [Helobdella robusta]ESN98492.1 hypothetical protein HELRODRAFT_84435 [Helobdella robusta]
MFYRNYYCCWLFSYWKRNTLTKPDSRSAVVEWFQKIEAPRGAGMMPNTNQIAEWFHGMITREESEGLLSNQKPGSFLIRVSDKIWGYTVSYKCQEKCKHFLLDASPLSSQPTSLSSPYRFFGANSKLHDTLYDFVQYHKTEPISMKGNEFLINACGQADPSKPDYKDLFQVQ